MSKKHHTIRNNHFDSKCVNMTPIYIDNDGVEHSINKNKNWELLDDPTIKQIKFHKNIEGKSENTAISNHRPIQYGGGTVWCTYKKGRNYVTIDGQRQNDSFKIEEQQNCIMLPFGKNEYPINREPHINHSSQCLACFRHDGRISQLKGLGNKSINKNKGMRRETNKDLEFYHDFRC